MESKMVKVFEKTMELEKGTLICVRRKWLWFREKIIKERLTDRMFIFFITIQIYFGVIDVNSNILIHWILSQNDSVQKGITVFMYTDWTLTNNSSILKRNHNSFIQLYSKLLETNDLRHAILIETAQVQGSIEHSKATKKIWCPECSP